MASVALAENGPNEVCTVVTHSDLVSANCVLIRVVVTMVPTEQSAQADFIHETR